MASFAALGAIARRRTTNAMARYAQKRSMGLGAAPPPPEWTGIDKVVRSYLPYDYQIAAAILGVYSGFFMIYKIKSAFTKKPVEAAPEPVKAEATTVAAGEIPDPDSPEFEKFLETILENEEQLKALIEKAA